MDLRLTKENILRALNENMLDRNAEVIEFARMLDRCKEASIIAINGAWGCGKSFFIRQVCEVLDHDYQKKRKTPLAAAEDFEKIEEIINQHEELKIEPLDHYFITIYYDAWCHDDHDDPLLSLIYEIESRYEELFCKKDSLFDDTCDILKNQIEKKRGLRSIIEAEKMKEDFRKLLDALYGKEMDGSEKGRILIVIDELDRCKPDYAVKILERIKHFVDLEKVFFVYCLNKVELCKSIECFYGRNLESTMYLNKFFDTTYDLNIKDVSSYFYQIAGEFPHNYNINLVIIGLAKHLRFSLRECNQLAGVMKGGLFIKKEAEEDIWIAENIFYPIIAALRICNAQECRNFLGGKSEDYLGHIYDEVKEIRQLADKSGKKSGKAGLLAIYRRLFCFNRSGRQGGKERGVCNHWIFEKMHGKNTNKSRRR